ncbi:MAG: hypothetical protein C0625_15290 [Arcobacter sp.]|nr:MAG: hypothetical protein C0625_15290 [Arcobacter sp.]
MKIFKICLFLLISSSILYAVTPKEFEKIVSQYKMINNTKEDIHQISFKTKDGKIKVSIEKQIFDDGDIAVNSSIDFNKINVYSDDKYGHSISHRYDISAIATLCYSKNNDMYLVSQVSSLGILKKGGQIGGVNGIITLDKKQNIIFYLPMLYKIDYKNPSWNNSYFNEEQVFGRIHRTYTSYNPKEFYPYYNEEKILERLYETGTCDREATKEANIQVLVNGKWIPQEESWNIKKESKLYTINLKKQPLYKTPPIKTKMYLIKGDKVEILEEKDDWYYILYHGKKDIKAWIPKSAVE